MEQPARQSGAAGCQGLPEKLLDDRFCRPGNPPSSAQANFVGAQE